MPRPPNIIRPVKLKTSLPEDLRAWLDLHLWSETEGRVPHGAYQRLIETLLREYKEKVETPPYVPLNAETLGICPVCKFPPDQCTCRGSHAPVP